MPIKYLELIHKTLYNAITSYTGPRVDDCGMNSCNSLLSSWFHWNLTKICEYSVYITIYDIVMCAMAQSAVWSHSIIEFLRNWNSIKLMAINSGFQNQAI